MTFRCAIVVLLTLAANVDARAIILTSKLHHLRVGDVPEWSDFPAQSEGPRLSLSFRRARNDSEWTLRLRQQDVKQTWKVLLNGKDLARLAPDENDMVIYLPIAAGMLDMGENRLTIETGVRIPDDIRVGEIVLDDRPVAKVLNEGTIEVTVQEATRGGKAAPVPCRITVVNARERS